MRTPAPTINNDVSEGSDRALMTRIAAGDRRAFEAVYRAHRTRTLGQARALCGSRELAEDLTQECFASLWRNAHLYRAERGSTGAWLTGILRNRAIDAWRRAAARPVEVTDNGSTPRAHEAEIAGTVAERSVVKAQLAALPEEQRDVLFLVYFADLTYAEVAASSGTSLGTVKGRGRLGLQKLRAALDEQSGFPNACAA